MTASAANGHHAHSATPGSTFSSFEDGTYKSVAIIGAGAAGLAAAKEMALEGHRPSVFEQAPNVGGVWAYTDDVEADDWLGQNPSRSRVHSSMYAGLRTNLPRELMSYFDFPFVPEWMGSFSKDSRRYCSHEEVQAYLEAFCDAFQLQRYIQYNTQVVKVAMEEEGSGTDGNRDDGLPWPRWLVTTNTVQDGCPPSVKSQWFDAVLVANGHFAQPALPSVAGMDVFPGLQMHSHNYRQADMFRDEVVVVVGAASSGTDIAAEIAHVAKQVHWCAGSWKKNPLLEGDSSHPIGPKGNIWRQHMLTQLRGDGSGVLDDGTLIPVVHSVVYCTGYQYELPFLEDATLVKIDQRRIYPLYQHVFPPSVAPTLSFIGIPWDIVPLPLCEMQAKWIARVLSGRVRLPNPEAMLQHLEAYYKQLHESGVPLQEAHRMPRDTQWEYIRWMIRQCGTDVTPLPSWRPEMYSASRELKVGNPYGYRDTWLRDDLAAAATAEFKRLKLQELQRQAGVTSTTAVSAL